MENPSRRRELGEAAWLALVPVGVALVLGLLLAPRAPAPEGVPLPIADPRAIADAEARDHNLAERARSEPLSGPVRALGSAVRAFHVLEAQGADLRALGDARRAVDAALIEALAGGVAPLVSLRAVQLEGFLAEIRSFEQTGQQSAELQALGGDFVRAMQSEGWSEGRTFAAEPSVLRVMFKEMWQHFLGLDGREGLALSVDEQRELYAFYLSHPHPSKGMRDALDAARRGARDDKACRAIVEAEHTAIEAWRSERIARLAQLDPSYPADYARGVVSYGRGEFAASARAFRSWLDKHPEGPLALRARNYLRAAIEASRAL